MRSRVLIPVALFVTLIVTPLTAQGPLGGQTAADRHKSGHSKLGEAFDEGPRERPAKIDGIGRTTFPSRRRSPKCRSGSIRATRCSTRSGSSKPSAPSAGRSSSTLTRRCRTGASRARPAATGRERSCARPRAARHAARRASATTSRPGRCNTKTARENGDARKDFHRALERLVLKYPDDVEAKALYAYEAMGENRVGTELLIRQVLAVDPNHPGAHHYRIHNWDDEDGALALESCRGTERSCRASATPCTCRDTSTPASACTTRPRSRSTPPRAPRSPTWGGAWCSRTTPGTTRTTATT